ncbi:FAD/FMN-containing isoamyl alcohol oxidase-like protein MreA [Lindgomyces ingoldianus]|uniref:FAD/FMN-containing isoamyl alcohol oxidase-like protein MreA n=1 Tax=Lindgomyces ingoldianus TaxID=673940 RepID=A0ACB6R216_9PLEO|nr:FAD/FMN-containing isoamyl alcohol oxidase-like protein MreA [Lindgomyces ingoldianus]KAF2473186.1 FAD/FMN-containing isoamyl alcohol oxidase-like protein MreA [Lindgomyces ingoldianus]
MKFLVQSFSVFVFVFRIVLAYNFPYEDIQLKDTDVINNTDIAFGKPSPSRPSVSTKRCKIFPGDADWPSPKKWNDFNLTLGGALIKGFPPAAACYPGPNYDEARCAYVRKNSGSSLFVMEDPTIPGGQWQTGNSCPLPAVPTPGLNLTLANYTCNLNGFPSYVVRATTIKHVQAAINLARNKNIRLVIKNTGHDFLGRNTGGGSLQVWMHQMKQFEYLPSFTMGKYHGQAARVGASLQTFDLISYMEKYNITMVIPGGSTIAVYGGYAQGGGHGLLTSRFGLGADQILSLEVVTADGRFVHADPDTNQDLFWAIRGGGGSTFGIVTSAVVKVYPAIPVSQSSFNFQTGPIFGNATNTVSVPDKTFWEGIKVYFSHMTRICDAKGIGWNYINTIPPINAPGLNRSRTFNFVNQITLPGFNAGEAKEFIAPLIRDLNAIGINLTNPQPKFSISVARHVSRPPGDGTGNGRYGSRLFPRSSLEDPESDSFLATMVAIRSFVEEGGYAFHSVDFTPTKEIAGYPGSNSAVNPAFREGILHATGFDTGSYGPDASPAQQIANHKRLNEYIEKWREASPGAGAYMNEADTEEPDFQQSFYGYNYDRLLRIKRKVDPWGVFYAVTAVGSDEWIVEGTQGLPTQQGRLCRVDE